MENFSSTSVYFSENGASISKLYQLDSQFESRRELEIIITKFVSQAICCKGDK
jgi:hypothetical protein